MLWPIPGRRSRSAVRPTHCSTPPPTGQATVPADASQALASTRRRAGPGPRLRPLSLSLGACASQLAHPAPPRAGGRDPRARLEFRGCADDAALASPRPTYTARRACTRRVNKRSASPGRCDAARNRPAPPRSARAARLRRPVSAGALGAGMAGAARAARRSCGSIAYPAAPSLREKACRTNATSRSSTRKSGFLALAPGFLPSYAARAESSRHWRAARWAGALRLRGAKKHCSWLGRGVLQNFWGANSLSAFASAHEHSIFVIPQRVVACRIACRRSARMRASAVRAAPRASTRCCTRVARGASTRFSSTPAQSLGQAWAK